MIAIIFLAVIFYLIYKWGTSTFDYFEKKGIPYNKPYPFIGSRIGMLLRNSSAIDFILELYNEFKDEK
jgi:cytochrome P450 family 9